MGWWDKLELDTGFTFDGGWDEWLRCIGRPPRYGADDPLCTINHDPDSIDKSRGQKNHIGL